MQKNGVIFSMISSPFLKSPSSQLVRPELNVLKCWKQFHLSQKFLYNFFFSANFNFYLPLFIIFVWRVRESIHFWCISSFWSKVSETLEFFSIQKYLRVRWIRAFSTKILHPRVSPKVFKIWASLDPFSPTNLARSLPFKSTHEKWC